MEKTPKHVFHGTSGAFLEDMSENGISAPSYWTDSLEKAQAYANSYPDGVVLQVNLEDHDFAANMQVAQCMLDDGDIDVLPSESDLMHSLEYLEGIVCTETVFRFEQVSQELLQASPSEMLPQRATISRMLRDLANERWPIDESQPQDQTQSWAGECGLFVDAAWPLLVQAGIVFSDEGMIGKFSQLGCEVRPPPGLSMDDISKLGIEEQINHHWLVSEGRHFDASCPDGVDSVFDLRSIRQTAADVLERDHPKLLHTLCRDHEWWRDSVLMLIDFRSQRAAAEAPKPVNARGPRF